MKNIFIAFLVIISSFIINTNYVYAAKDARDIKVGGAAVGEDLGASANCDSVFGDPNNPEYFAFYLQKAFDILKFAGIILAIAMTIKDLVTAVSEQKNDSYQKIGKNTLKRIIYATLIFILPGILTYVFELLGLYGTCGIN